MKAMTICSAVAAMLALAGLGGVAQEILPTPDPVGGTKIDADAGIKEGAPTQPSPAAGATAAPTKNNWRYRWYNGRWWYWTPQNRWMWYGDDRRWVAFDANRPPPVVQSDGYTAGYGGYYYHPGPAYYYPGPGYWTGRYPGVGVGVGPYGNVGVGVGPRIGVDVWGPHGGVRVGRIHVGW